MCHVYPIRGVPLDATLSPSLISTLSSHPQTPFATLTSTLWISRMNARSCIISLMETPSLANKLQSFDTPPGPSLTVTVNLQNHQK